MVVLHKDARRTVSDDAMAGELGRGVMLLLVVLEKTHTREKKTGGRVEWYT
jgi:hypothetical protein